MAGGINWCDMSEANAFRVVTYEQMDGALGSRQVLDIKEYALPEDKSKRRRKVMRALGRELDVQGVSSLSLEWMFSEFATS